MSVLLAMLAIGPLAAAAHADDTIGALGVNDLRSDGIMLANADFHGAADLDLLSGAGGRLYRGRLRLDCVDPQHTGSFDFTGRRGCWGLSYDELVRNLALRDVTYLPILIDFHWNGQADLPLPPTADGSGGSASRAEFAAFAAAAAKRYGPGGAFWSTCSCPAHPIHAWEIWNEQNNGWWWGGHASADDYATVFSETRAALRSADPAARAVVGGLVWDPHGEASFIAPETMIARLARDDANAFDAVAVHPYTDARGATGAQMAAAAQTYVDQAAQAIRLSTGPGPDGAPRQQVWVTEMGWSDTDAAPETVADGLRSFVGGLDGGARKGDNVGPVLWYMLRDNTVHWGRDDQLGLRLTTPSGADAGPKPAWNAFADLATRAAPVALPAALGTAPAYVAPPAAPEPAAKAAVVPAPVPVATVPAVLAKPSVPASTPAPSAAAQRPVIVVRATPGSRALTLRVTCVRAGAACAGAVRLEASLPSGAGRGRQARLRTTVVGGRTLRVPGGRTAALRVALTRTGVAALRRAGRLRVEAVISARDGSGRSVVTTAAATLRR